MPSVSRDLVSPRKSQRAPGIVLQWANTFDHSSAQSLQVYVLNIHHVVFLFADVGKDGVMQAFKAVDFDNIVFQAPFFGLEGDNLVDLA